MISLGAASFLIFSFLVLNSEVNWYSVVFTFASTLLMYNLQRLHKLQYQELDFMNMRHIWISEHKNRIQYVVIGCGFLLVALVPFFSIHTILGLALLGIISFFYSYPTKRGNLRSVAGFKIFLIAFVWSATVFVFTSDWVIVMADIILFAHNFLFILAITIPFDIRDLDFDKKKYKTIPQVLGEFASRILASTLMVISFIILTFQLGEFSIFLSLVYGIFALLCFYATSTRKELYFSGLMDFTLTFLAICFWLYQNVSIFHF